MGSLATIYIKREILDTLLRGVTKKNDKGVELTISISDESNKWGQNVSAYVSQTKEQREAKKDRYYAGNGKVFWTDGKIEVAKKEDEQTQSENKSTSNDDDDDLPF